MLYRLTRFSQILLVIIFILLISPPSYSSIRTNEPIQETENILKMLEAEYGAGIILGEPLEVEKFRIIPVTRIEIRYKIQDQEKNISLQNLTGGSIHPMGLIILSPQGFEFIRIHESLAGQILERLPVIIQWINDHFLSRGTYASQSRIPLDEMIASLTLLVPEKIFGLGIVPWWVQKLMFASAWYILAFITAFLFSGPSGAIAANMKTYPLKSIVSGIAGSMIILFFTVIMTASIIGIPLSIILIVFYLIGSFIGRVSIGILLGGLVTGSYRPHKVPASAWFIPGGAIMAALRMIPRYGWIIWLAFGLSGFGGVVVTLFKHKRLDQSSESN